MQLNQCLAFEPHEPYVILAEYEMYLHLPLCNTLGVCYELDLRF